MLTALLRKTPPIALVAGTALWLIGPAHAAPVTFQITSLGTTNATAIEHVSVTGDDRGSMAVTPTAVYYTGDNNTGRFNSNLTSSTSLSRRDGIFSDLNGGGLYSFGTSSTTPFSYSFAGGFTFTHLLALDVNANPTGSSVALSSPITFAHNASNGVFAGYDSVLVFRNTGGGGTFGGDATVTGDVLKIDLATGLVTNLASRTIDVQGVENWAFYGVAEYFGGSDYIAYAHSSPSNFPTNEIVRTRVADGVTSTIASFPGGLSDLGTFGVAPTLNRWYFHYEGSGLFRSGDETIGFADATFNIVAAAVPQPSVLTLLAIGGTLVAYRRPRSRKSAA